MTPRIPDGEILESVRRIITDLNWIIIRSNDLMNAGWPPEDIERERIELRNWRAIEKWLAHKIKISQERR